MLSEKLKERFYLDDMEMRFATVDELAASSKVLKLEKSFKKKHQTVWDLLNASPHQRAVPSSSKIIPDDAFAAFAKYVKEILNVVPKSVSSFDCPQFLECDQASCLGEELRKIKNTEDLRGKYVKLGVEEQKRLNKSKEKRIKETDDNFEFLKREINARMEQDLQKAAAAFFAS
ncbi:unnamed protein product [Gongylonema pulchrum]|uniref:Uncharacterized protein n=2 Tax=Gongylonema pulchrum TaxID=637853 RepID=A0A3P7LWA4_9BILA|nr:unnamed protein product [Gongylonema pulchrum]